ncbi:MAG TPA: hypothetical protein VGC21_23060 [Telluria sp.]|jgi:hypothetical protein
MFASKVDKHQTQRTTGDQASLRLLAQRASHTLPSKESGAHKGESAGQQDMASPAAMHGASWDFSKIPVSRPNRPTQPSSSFSLPPLTVGGGDNAREHESVKAKASSAACVSCSAHERQSLDRTKVSDDGPLAEEVTLPDAGVTAGPDAGVAPPASPADAGVPAKKAELKSGPTYTPSGTVKATKSGTTKTASFKMAAEFKHDPAKGIDASVGEIRQYIKWTAAETSPRTGAWDPAASFPGDTWYEDRDPAGKRYGHRSGGHAECVSINHYEDAKGVKDCANGAKFVGEDKPVAAASRTGKWSFELRAVDTVSGSEIGTPASVAIDWNV